MSSMTITIAVAAALTLLLLVAGAATTKIDGWYRDLDKPVWTPPNWAFGPAWTLILGLAATAGVLAWSAGTADARRLIALAFGVNAGLHLLWSPLFFRLRRPDLALFEMLFLWGSIVAVAGAVAKAAPAAAWLLLPYLVWVTYAAALNLAIVRRNPRSQAQTISA